MIGSSNEHGTPRADGTPVFRPFVGSRYATRLDSALDHKGTGAELERVHLLGESHYLIDDFLEHHQLSDLTCSVIGEFRDGGSRTITKILMAAEGSSLGDLNRDAWEDYAFSNFVQRPMARSDDRPTAHDWEQARNLLFAQLAITKPTILAVFGHTMWRELPTVGRSAGPVPATPVSDAVDDLWLYEYGSDVEANFTVAVRLPHPAAKRGLFDAEKAYRRINAARYFYSNLAIGFRKTAGGE